MDSMSDWLQSNWYDLGSLLFQFAILATLAWFGWNILKTVRVYLGQEEVPARPALSQAASGEYGGEVASSGNGLIAWLRTPMRSGGDGPFRRMKRWLLDPWGAHGEA
jgi:hypothetical protein